MEDIGILTHTHASQLFSPVNSLTYFFTYVVYVVIFFCIFMEKHTQVKLLIHKVPHGYTRANGCSKSVAHSSTLDKKCFRKKLSAYNIIFFFVQNLISIFFQLIGLNKDIFNSFYEKVFLK